MVNGNLWVSVSELKNISRFYSSVSYLSVSTTHMVATRLLIRNISDRMNVPAFELIKLYAGCLLFEHYVELFGPGVLVT